MFKFNNNHIFTGYLKQLLASFNLPTCKIYTKYHQQYKDKYGEESPEIIKSIIKDDESNETLTRYIPYIKDGKLKEYIQVKTSPTTVYPEFFWKEINTYQRNKKILNYTKNLKIKNNIYDSYTHEYLGEYLRFLRDYDHLDLMPLYNCFSNRLCTNILFECKHKNVKNIETSIVKTENDHFIFNSSDSHYKIFMLPVKLFKEYTVAIDCDSQVEICCGIYGKYQDTSELFNVVAHNTYIKYGRMSFNSPVLFSKLKDLNDFIISENDEMTGIETVTRLAQKENDLKMFIKLPTDNNSTITVLEGNYCSWNDKYVEEKTRTLSEDNISYYRTDFIDYKNHYITNYLDEKLFRASAKIISDIDYEKTRDFKPITQLQLLTLNTRESYPFSDYLVEYLLDNAITHIDESSDNIKRVQTAVLENTDGKISHTNEIGEQDGIWDSRTRAIIYDAMQHSLFTIAEEGEGNNKQQYLKPNDAVRVKINRNLDTLGYINHVSESDYKCFRTNKRGQKIIESLANIDIYPDQYLEQKEK